MQGFLLAFALAAVFYSCGRGAGHLWKLMLMRLWTDLRGHQTGNYVLITLPNCDSSTKSCRCSDLDLLAGVSLYTLSAVSYVGREKRKPDYNKLVPLLYAPTLPLRELLQHTTVPFNQQRMKLAECITSL